MSRNSEKYSVAGFVELVSAARATEEDIRISTEYLNSGENIPAQVKSDTLSRIARDNKSNESRYEKIRTIFALGISNMEPEFLCEFAMLEGVAEDIVTSANFTRDERKEAAIRSKITKEVNNFAATLSGSLIPAETRNDLINSHRIRLEQAYNLNK